MEISHTLQCTSETSLGPFAIRYSALYLFIIGPRKIETLEKYNEPFDRCPFPFLFLKQCPSKTQAGFIFLKITPSTGISTSLQFKLLTKIDNYDINK